MLKYGLIIYKIAIPSLIYVVLSTKLSEAEVLLADVEWASAIRLVEYKGYKSASLSKYIVPDGATEVLWDISASALPDCPQREVFIYIRHGSYPLASPYNETYPESFNVEDSHKLKLTTNNVTLPYSIKNPKAGQWFLAGFLPKAEHKYTQAGLNNDKCAYGMGVRVISKSLAKIDEITAGKTYTLSLQSNKSKTLRLIVPEGTISYTVLVAGCSRETSNSTSCPLMMTTSSHHLPSIPSSPYMNCSSENCALEYNSPVIKEWNYITVTTHSLSNVTEIQFNLEVNTQNCLMNQYVFTELIDPVEEDENKTKIVKYRTKPAPPIANNTCVLLQQMGRFDVMNEDFVSVFIFPDPYFYPWPNMRLFCPDHQVLLTYFDLSSERDSGGTLKIVFSTSNLYLIHTQYASVVLCLMKYSIPSLSTVDECSEGVRLFINTTSPSNSVSHVYIPYPTGGRWYLGMKSKCYDKSGQLERCMKPPIVSVQVYITRCVDNKCGNKGNCEEFISGMLLFSACDCLSNWRGYGCTDGSEAESDGVLLSTMLLLTLSNAFFIPGILFSIKRRMFVEGLVYVFTMFFSTFYHACDVNNVKYTFCMMDYDVLSFCDFYGSILSFWVTLLAMSRLNDTIRSIFHMLGALCVALGVEHNKHGLWVFVIPAITGVIIMSISWVVQCRKRKGCYPSKWRYVKFILPGVLLAGTGLIIFAFLETDENYKYTHSAWHVVIALSIVFLLPSRKNLQDGYNLVPPEPERVEAVSMMPADGRVEDSDDECILQPNGIQSRTDWNIIL